MSDGGGMASITANAIADTPASPSFTPGAAYTPAQQGPIYKPSYQDYQPQAKSAQPQLQQMPDYQSGLQAAMMHMMQQYNRPAMRAPLQQSITPYNSQALSYRPNMAGITANLNRVAPSVAEQQRRQAEADAAAAAKAEEDARNAENNSFSMRSYNPSFPGD